MHLNNMLGEQDLNPLGFHRHTPGARVPSMMAPTVVLSADDQPEMALGSAGSNRIRSAIIQTIIGVVDRGLAAGRGFEPAHPGRREIEGIAPGRSTGSRRAAGWYAAGPSRTSTSAASRPSRATRTRAS